MKKKLMLAMVAWGCISCGMSTWGCGLLCEWLSPDYHCDCSADPNFVQRDARQPHALAALRNALKALDTIEPRESHSQAMSKARDSLGLELGGDFYGAATLFAQAASECSSIEVAQFADASVVQGAGLRFAKVFSGTRRVTARKHGASERGCVCPRGTGSFSGRVGP